MKLIMLLILIEVLFRRFMCGSLYIEIDEFCVRWVMYLLLVDYLKVGYCSFGGGCDLFVFLGGLRLVKECRGVLVVMF